MHSEISNRGAQPNPLYSAEIWPDKIFQTICMKRVYILSILYELLYRILHLKCEKSVIPSIFTLRGADFIKGKKIKQVFIASIINH